MKSIFYKLLLLFALIPTISFCNNDLKGYDFNGRHTKEKKLSKTYTVSPNSLLKIDNSYGNVDITTWDQNTVSIEVFIKTNGNDEKKVKEKLDEIDVEFRQNSSGVSAKTHFSRDNASWWSQLFGGSSNVSMEINYVIKAPVTNHVDLSNDYGHIFLDKLTGNAKISCDYGRVDIGELHGNSNQVSLAYSRNSHFGYINRAVIKAAYSEFTIEDAKSLEINADYTTSKIKRTELLKFNCDYGSLAVDKVKRISGSGDYLTTRIGDIHQAADINFDYGSLSIDKIIKGAGEIKISSNYTGVKIGYDRAHPFRFDIKSSYSNVKGLDTFEINKQNQGSNTKSYSGYHLNESGRGNVIIDSRYGSINFQSK